MRRSWLILLGAVVVLLSGLLFYSQTDAFAWDEGFHLLTAQLISRGKRPYIDFFFPQTPLNAYWNALWMRLLSGILGSAWRPSHIAASLCTAGTLFLTGDFLLRRFPVNRWRLGAALAAVALVGCNVQVIEYGTVGQGYALCSLLIVGAFRVAIRAVDRRSLLLPAVTGLLAAAAAASSLLTASVTPVLLLWTLFGNRSGNRWAKAIAFLAGAAVPFLPVLWLFAQAPRQVLFQIIQFHLVYRRAAWEGAAGHDVMVLTAWLSTPEALILGLLAIAGVVFIARRSGWDRATRSAFYLSGWLAAALGLHISTAHPTFARYYLLTVPFLAILAAAELYDTGARFGAREHPVWPASLLILLLAGVAIRTLYNDRSDALVWRDLERVAKKVDEVTPPGGAVLADEHIYLLTGRTPPSGLEHHDAHKLTLPPDFARSLHVLSWPELTRAVASGAYNTAVSCEDKDTEKEGLETVFSQKQLIEDTDCTVFWGQKKPGRE